MEATLYDIFEWKEHDKKLHCCDNVGQARWNHLEEQIILKS